jgi:hypothetical protein
MLNWLGRFELLPRLERAKRGHPLAMMRVHPDEQDIENRDRVAHNGALEPQSPPSREGENIQIGGTKVGMRSGARKSDSTRARRTSAGCSETRR